MSSSLVGREEVEARRISRPHAVAMTPLAAMGARPSVLPLASQHPLAASLLSRHESTHHRTAPPSGLADISVRGDTSLVSSGPTSPVQPPHSSLANTFAWIRIIAASEHVRGDTRQPSGASLGAQQQQQSGIRTWPPVVLPAPDSPSLAASRTRSHGYASSRPPNTSVRIRVSLGAQHHHNPISHGPTPDLFIHEEMASYPRVAACIGGRPKIGMPNLQGWLPTQPTSKGGGITEGLMEGTEQITKQELSCGYFLAFGF